MTAKPAGRCSCLCAVALLLLAGVELTTTAAPLQLLSARNPLNPLPAGGNGNSVSPVLSADGRFVLFSSSANNLVPGDNNQLGLDVFLRDRWSNSTVLVSSNFAGLGGGNGYSMSAAISTNGQFVTFQSDASDLLPDDTNDASDIFVRDLQAGTTELISIAADGGWGNDPSTDPAITPDGRYVAFVSEASNLVPGDTNGIADVFVRDRVAGTTTLASVGARLGPEPTYVDATMSAPVITPDGRYVAFSSTATNLVPGQTSTLGDVYLRDLVAGTTTWVSSNAPAIVLSNLNLRFVSSSHPVLSSDGRFVTFKCGLGGGVSPALILQYDGQSGGITIITTNAFPGWTYNDDLYGPEATPDGRFIAYCAYTANNTGTHSSVHLWDNQSATDTLVSQDMSGSFQTNTMSRGPVLSPDGRFVVFLSNATNMVANAISNGYHAYIRDMNSGTTQLVDADTNGVGSVDVNGTGVTVSSNGQFVAFSSPASGGKNRFLDVFVRDVANGTNEMISQRDATVVSATGNGMASQLAVSSDGRWIAFTSGASDLVTNDFNTDSDVFLWDTVGGTNALVSVGLDGNTGSGGYSAWPGISADGRFIVFQSAATNLVANDTNGASDIFLRDMQSGTTVLVSVSTDGVHPGNNDSWGPSMSQDGRYITFLTRATNLAATGTTSGAAWRDMQSGTTMILPGSISNGLAPSMSPDGRYVAYSTSTSALNVWDTVNSTSIATVVASASTISTMQLSPTGTRLLYSAVGPGSTVTTVVMDLVLNTNIFKANSGVQAFGPAQWSADGRFVAFATAMNLPFTDSNGTNDVVLLDTTNGTIRVVSMNQGGTATGNASSDLPTLSRDGRFVVYRSFATDIVPGVTSVPNLIMYDRLTGSNVLLTVEQPASSWSWWMAEPVVNTNGSTIAFQSWAPGLAAQDLNSVADAFAYEQQPSVVNPTNPPAFLVQIAPVGTNGNELLTWPAIVGPSYQMQFTTNLANAQWITPAGTNWVVGSQGYFNVSATQPSAFYRVILVP